MARAPRSPFDVSRSTVVAAATALITRRSMTPMTRRTVVRPTQQWMPPEAVQSSCIGGISVIDDAVVENERAHARPLARVGRRIGSRRRCNHGDWIRTSTQRPRAFAPVVVFDASVALLLRGEPDAEVGVEIGAERGGPRERPPH